MKEYATLPRSQELEPHHQIQFFFLQGGLLHFCKGYSQRGDDKYFSKKHKYATKGISK